VCCVCCVLQQHNSDIHEQPDTSPPIDIVATLHTHHVLSICTHPPLQVFERRPEPKADAVDTGRAYIIIVIPRGQAALKEVRTPKGPVSGGMGGGWGVAGVGGAGWGWRALYGLRCLITCLSHTRGLFGCPKPHPIVQASLLTSPLPSSCPLTGCWLHLCPPRVCAAAGCAAAPGAWLCDQGHCAAPQVSKGWHQQGGGQRDLQQEWAGSVPD
jgi:hypothetical protein